MRLLTYLLTHARLQCNERADTRADRPAYYNRPILRFYNWIGVNNKSFPIHTAHRAALLSVSVAPSHTPSHAARPWMWGQKTMLKVVA